MITTEACIEDDKFIINTAVADFLVVLCGILELDGLG